MGKYFLQHKMLRRFLSKIFNLLRECAHKEYVEQVKSTYKIHPSFRVGYGTIIFGAGSIEIDEGSYIGSNSFITSEPATAKIAIGKHCSLGHNIHIRTQVHVRKRWYRDELKAPVEGEDITIGDYVWVGANVYIAGGVTIGENTIVGANSVVTHNIPPNTIYGGVPARLIRNKVEYPE